MDFFSASRRAIGGLTRRRRRAFCAHLARARYSMFRSDPYSSDPLSPWERVRVRVSLRHTDGVIPGERQAHPHPSPLPAGEGVGRRRVARYLLVIAVLSLVLVACSQKMREQPKLNPDDPSAFFSNGTSSQAPVADTVARGFL